MSNDTKILDDILYHGLRPWLDQNAPDEKFAAKLSSAKEETPAFQFKYEIDFLRPFNHKTKYYAKLIINEVTRNSNYLYQLINEDDNNKLKKYWLNDTLNKKLKTRIKDIGKIIKKNDYSLTYIDPKKTSFDMDQDHRSNTFIIQLLKLAYIHVYLEIQEAFKDSIEDHLIIDDFYIQLLFEPVPDKHYLKKIHVIELKPISALEKDSKTSLSPLTSFKYKQFDTNPDKLNDLCDSLKKNNFIAQNTTLPNFKKAFSGKKVTTPVIWTGNPSEFAYFIKLIHNTHKYVEDLRQKQWKVALLCFFDSKGDAFPITIRKLQKPKLSAEAIEKCILHMD